MSVDRNVTGLGLVACKKVSLMMISDLNRLVADIEYVLIGQLLFSVADVYQGSIATFVRLAKASL